MLTPQEADEVLGTLRDRAHAGDCTVVMITHKFREVTAFADDVLAVVDALGLEEEESAKEDEDALDEVALDALPASFRLG